MRQIKFRGLYEGHWVYGNLIQGVGSSKGQCQIEHTDISDHYCWDVDPKTVGQYTGLKDKNVKEIYEGDILLFKGKRNYSHGKPFFNAPVKFENGAFTIDILRSPLKTNGDYINWGLAHDWALGTKALHNGNGTIEIIGNIYENPELL